MGGPFTVRDSASLCRALRRFRQSPSPSRGRNGGTGGSGATETISNGCFGCVSRVPHSPQNLAVVLDCAPHDPQNSPVAVSPPTPSPLGSTSVLKHPGFHAHLVTCDQCAARSGGERSTRLRLLLVGVGRSGAWACRCCTDAAVAQPAVAVCEPGDRAFDHGRCWRYPATQCGIVRVSSRRQPPGRRREPAAAGIRPPACPLHKPCPELPPS